MVKKVWQTDGQTDRRTDRRTENTICRAAWSQLKIYVDVQRIIFDFNYFIPIYSPWWRHRMETFSVLLAFCAGNSPVAGKVPSHRPVARSFEVFFNLRLNKRLSKQRWGWWFETPSRSLWRHRNDIKTDFAQYVTAILWLYNYTAIKFYIIPYWSGYCYIGSLLKFQGNI